MKRAVRLLGGLAEIAALHAAAESRLAESR